MLNDKTILVTGGTGLFGCKFVEMVFKRYTPRKIIIYSRDEYKQAAMKEYLNQHIDLSRIRFFIGDVRDRERLYRAFKGVDYVVHAAAMQRVATCEYNPFEAIKTNIHGAQNIIDAALDCGVKKVIALSVDKAVNPINLYGATKLVSDKLFTAANAYRGTNGTIFSVVRNGNIAGSRGSVIPTFQAVIDRGENELPITDMRMTRFFATAEQCVDIVIEALCKAKGGETYVAKLPSFYVKDLALAMKSDAVLKEIGIREGEKLHEIMITKDDLRSTYEYDKYYIIYPNFEWWDYERYFTEGGVKASETLEYTSDKNERFLSVEELRDIVAGLKVI